MAEMPNNASSRHQIACQEAGDLDALMGQYHDAVLVTFETTVRDRTALRDDFAGYLARLRSLRLVSTEKLAETDAALFVEATAAPDHGVARVSDPFALRPSPR